MIPNKYQQDIFEHVKNQIVVMMNHGIPKNLVCEAGAGCGKTSTTVNCLELIPRNLNTGFFAFNKDIVETLKNKVPSNVRVQTFHSSGFAALRYRFKAVKLDDKKMLSIFQNLVDTLYRSLNPEESGMLMSPFLKLIGIS